MNQAFDDALVTGYEAITDGMTNDVDDRHVLAAAVVGRADVIVTANLKHFPRHATEPLGIEAIGPDQFLCLQYDLAPSIVVEVIRIQSAESGHSPGKPRLSVGDVLDALRKSGAPGFVERIQGRPAAAHPRPRSPEARQPSPVEQ